MKYFVLFGPPGAGKGTQAKLICDKMNYEHISTGDMFRFNIKNLTPIGIKAKEYIDNGKLVPDEVVNYMLFDKINSLPKTNGILLDGFPRTIFQADELEKFLHKRNEKLSAVLSLEVDNENELITRLKNRALELGRIDDSDENIIKERMNVYHNETDVLKEYYINNCLLYSINAIGTIEEINMEIINNIDKILMLKSKL